MKGVGFKFSIIIPVYNVELYIADTIECLIGQSIGFEKNCEIILVDDGSGDGTAKVCKQYAEKYPKNIFYIKQKNAGPGAARNKGVKKARGKYVSLLDSDDILSANTLEEVYEFFESHYNEIDVIGIKMKFFEAKTGNHPLNYKFDAGNRVINLESEYESILGSAATGFFKRDVFDRHTFDHSVGRYSEDLRFMGEVLMDKMKFGVVTAPTYFYRKRHSQTSSQDGNKTDKFWYLGTPKSALLDMLLYAKDHNNGNIPKFIQYNVMYEMKWRFKQTKQTVLNNSELTQYKAQLYDLLKYIDDDVIMTQRGISITLKLFILLKKHNTSIDKLLTRHADGYYVGENIVFNPSWGREAIIDLVERRDNKIIIHGFTNKPIFSDENIICKSSGKEFIVSRVNRPHKILTFLDDDVYDFNCFSVTIPIQEDGQNIKFIIKQGNGETSNMNIVAQRRSGLPYYTRIGSYRALDDIYLLCHPNPGSLIVLKYTPWRQFIKETKYEMFLTLSYTVNGIRKLRDHYNYRKNQRIDDTPAGKVNLKESDPRKVSKGLLSKIGAVIIRLPLLYRLLYHLTKPFMGEIWLVTDRISAADDNGEVFFHYLMQQPSRGRKAYFVIDKHTDDYERIKQYGKVVNFMSVKHKFLTLHASKIISSEATEFVLNPFFGNGKYLWDLLDYDFVFLQHGIIRDDISSWLNKYNKNIRLFITSAKPEYDSVIKGNYGYTSREVVLTGLARYDNLKNNPKGKLILMPTWRQDIVGKPIDGTDKRYYNPNFTKSEFFAFWNTLIQDKRIAKALKDANMTAELYLHHGLRAQTKDFTKTPHVKLMDFPYDYPKAKQEGSLLVTDYSSVGLDFAYLKKPVIYAQFDVDTYYSSSVSTEGYLSYEEKGLGPVVYNYEDTVNEILQSISAGCVMEKKYIKRATDFFGYFDQHNSRRTYQTILNIDNNESLIKSIKKSSSFNNKRLDKWNEKISIPAYWWHYKYPVEQNFGDEITAYIVAAIWGIKLRWARPSESVFAGAGSIIELLNEHVKDNKVKVWGSGFIESGAIEASENLDIYAVRGPESYARISSKHKVAMGDPGILSNLVFNECPEKRYKVGIVAHYMDTNHSIVNELAQRKDVLIIDPLSTPDKVVMDITACEYIASSSLHGLIVADSFGVPNNWMPLSRKVKGGQYKFQDHYKATNRELVKINPAILKKDMSVNSMIEQYKPIKNLLKLQQELIESMPLKSPTQKR